MSCNCYCHSKIQNSVYNCSSPLILGADDIVSVEVYLTWVPGSNSCLSSFLSSECCSAGTIKKLFEIFCYQDKANRSKFIVSIEWWVEPEEVVAWFALLQAQIMPCWEHSFEFCGHLCCWLKYRERTMVKETWSSRLEIEVCSLGAMVRLNHWGERREWRVRKMEVN